MPNTGWKELYGTPVNEHMDALLCFKNDTLAVGHTAPEQGKLLVDVHSDDLVLLLQTTNVFAELLRYQIEKPSPLSLDFLVDVAYRACANREQYDSADIARFNQLTSQLLTKPTFQKVIVNGAPSLDILEQTIQHNEVSKEMFDQKKIQIYMDEKGYQSDLVENLLYAE